ncbi:MAG TPA: nitroreductase family deazaflavin-dependent oxidoreductase [Solirubrobacteraceae bacterium]|nr:nitroreductase family deazaflavin-dependent oxidoreductase [Solirubrobacteraceae bacterium]
MSRAADFYAKLSPYLAHRPGATAATRAHAWVMRASGGRLGTRLLGVNILVMRTIGRRSGQPREAPAFFVPHGDAFAVVASNAASKATPAWWLNLQANPDADALVRGKWSPVRARRATDAETAELWPRFVSEYKGFDHYKSIATREMPVVLLEPRAMR